MIGTKLGNWVLDKELGRGGMGNVYRAKLGGDVRAEGELGGPRYAAVKLLAVELAREPGFRERFDREIEALRRLKHANIVQLYESGEHEGTFYYVMDYVDGVSLDDLLDDVGRLAWEETLPLCVQICSALKHAHDHGVIHRDLKPTNLLLGSDGVLKLVDFGVAKVFANTPLTATHAVVGTADYMAPEQASGKPITRRADLYSLGVVMYRMLTGRPPFHADSVLDMMHKHQFARFDPPRSFVPDVPHALDTLVCQLLEKDPAKRPPDAYVVGRELESIRRRLARKADMTTDMAAVEATLADHSGTGDGGPAGPGPATLMSQLVRKELEDLNREGPISRMLNRAWLLVLLLAGVIGLLVYGLWPKSPDQLIGEIETLVAREDWREAQRQMEKLKKKSLQDEHAARAEQLHTQIEAGVANVLARRLVNSSPLAIKRPGSEAERFYREAAHDYQLGRIEQARQKWRQLVDAFVGLDAHREWVIQAQSALKESEAAESDLTAIESAIQMAKGEQREQGLKRLKALAALYADRQDIFAQAVRSRLVGALREMEGATGKGP